MATQMVRSGCFGKDSKMMVTYIDPDHTAQFILRGERLYRPMWMTPSICVFGYENVHNAELLLDRCVEPTSTFARGRRGGAGGGGGGTAGRAGRPRAGGGRRE